MAETRNIQLNRSTTYSGADIKVFIYRDLVSLLNKEKSGGGSFRDDTVTVSENSDVRTSSVTDGRTSLTDVNGISKPGENPGSKASQRTAPTNRGDAEYSDQGFADSVDATFDKGSFKGLSEMNLDSTISELGSLYAINYSSFREKMAVRTLGRTHAKHYTRGQRTIAGTMVFNVLQSHELMNFANREEGQYIAMLDQIEPFNLLLLFNNEYGSVSALHLFNVDINTESQSMSIDDLLLTNTMNFYAQDILPMEDIGNMFRSTNEMLSASIDNDVFRARVANTSRLTGLKDLGHALKGSAASDKRIQDLLKRSRGLF